MADFQNEGQSHRLLGGFGGSLSSGDFLDFNSLTTENHTKSLMHGFSNHTL